MEFRDPPDEFTLPLTAERLNWQLEVLGWSGQELSRRLNISSGTVRQMCRIGGSRRIPNNMARWIESLTWTFVALPQPPDWHPDLAQGAGNSFMAGERLRELLEVIGWSRHELATRLDIPGWIVRAMAHNNRPIPETLAAWLETLAAIIKSVPLPFGWEAGANVEAEVPNATTREAMEEARDMNRGDFTTASALFDALDAKDD